MSLSLQLDTLGDIVDHRDFLYLAPSRDIASEALFLLALFESVHLYVPPAYFGDVTIDASVVGASSVLPRDQEELKLWTVEAITAKAAALANIRLFEHNPRAGFVDLSQLRGLFSEVDEADLHHLGQLVLDDPQLDDRTRQSMASIAGYARNLCLDANFLKDVIRSGTRSGELTRGQSALFLLKGLVALRDTLSDMRSLTIAWMAIEAQCRRVRNRLRLVVVFSRSEIFLQTSEPDDCVRADRDGTQTSDRPVIARSCLDNQRYVREPKTRRERPVNGAVDDRVCRLPGPKR